MPKRMSIQEILGQIDERVEARFKKVHERPVTDEEKNFINGVQFVDNDLQRAVDLQAATGGRLNNVPPSLLNNPSTNLGNNVILTNDGSFAAQDVINIRGADALAEGYTITLSQPFVSTKGTPANLQNEQLIPVAVLIYGSGAVQNTCEVDWGYGQSFTLPGSSLRVQAKLANPSDLGAAFVPPAIPTKISLGAFASKGIRTRNSILYRSKNLGVIPHSNNQVMYIPACSTQVKLQWAPSTVTKVVLRVIDSSNVALNTMYEQDLSVNQNPIDLGGFSSGQAGALLFGQQQTSIIEVLNNDGAVDITSAWAIFTIEP